MTAILLALSNSVGQAQEHAAEPPKVTAAEVPNLIAKIQKGQSQEKTEAMFRLRGVRPTNAKLPAVHAVVELLKHDPDANVRSSAAEELGLLPITRESADVLFQASESADENVRLRAANSAPGAKEYSQQLLKMLKSTDSEVRVRAADKFLLDPVDDPAIVLALVNLLADEDRSVRASAAQAIARYGPKAGVAEPALMARVRVERDKLTLSFVMRALAAVGNLKPSDLPLLQIVLRKEHEYGIRLSCAKSIAKLGPQAAPATDDLIAVIRFARDTILQGACADALAAIGPAANRATPYLVAALQSPKHNDFRCDYAAALGTVATSNDKAAIDALQNALHNEDPAVQTAARLSLQKLGIKARSKSSVGKH